MQRLFLTTSLLFGMIVPDDALGLLLFGTAGRNAGLPGKRDARLLCGKDDCSTCQLLWTRDGRIFARR